MDGIGPKAVSSTEPRVAPVVRAAASAPVVPLVREDRANEPALTAATRTLAAAPPVDADRVARIRKAIQDGHYPIVPERVADRLLALKLDWKPK